MYVCVCLSVFVLASFKKAGNGKKALKQKGFAKPLASLRRDVLSGNKDILRNRSSKWVTVFPYSCAEYPPHKTNFFDLQPSPVRHLLYCNANKGMQYPGHWVYLYLKYTTDKGT